MASIWRGTIWFANGYRNYTKAAYEKNAKNFNPKDLEKDITAESYLITGANSGLGYSTAEAIAKRGATVHMLCRSKERGEKAQQQIIEDSKNDKVILHLCDLSSQKEIREFASNFINSGQPLNVLVNNAGVMQEKRTVTDEGFEATFAINTLGTFLITNLLLPTLIKTAKLSNSTARVIIVSSGGMLTQKMDVTDFQFTKDYNGTVAYAQTKRAQSYLTELYADKLKDEPIQFFCTHPGWADTAGVRSSMKSFHEKMGDKLRTQEQGADTIIWLSTSDNKLLLDKQNSGKFYFDRAIVTTHLTACATSSPQSDIDKLWDTCCTSTKSNMKDDLSRLSADVETAFNNPIPFSSPIAFNAKQNSNNDSDEDNNNNNSTNNNSNSDTTTQQNDSINNAAEIETKAEIETNHDNNSDDKNEEQNNTNINNNTDTNEKNEEQ